jgi:peptidoglycan/xylan/chitin deacetylase (PgdA/CDA1 family)
MVSDKTRVVYCGIELQGIRTSMAAARNRLVLEFHGIGARPDWVGAAENYYWCDEPTTFGNILNTIPEASKVTGRSIELTFDDGNVSDFTIAAPELAARGLTGSIFVCAGRIGQPGYLDRAAMIDMIACGLKIGSHGWSHIDWRKTDDKTLEQEVNGAKRTIEDIIGQKVDCVAIPFGSYDRRVMGKLGEFTTIYTSDRGLASSSSRVIPRVPYQKDWTEGTLMRLLSGESALKRLERALRRAAKRLR